MFFGIIWWVSLIAGMEYGMDSEMYNEMDDALLPRRLASPALPWGFKLPTRLHECIRMGGPFLCALLV